MISYFLDVFSYLFELSHSIIIPIFFHALLQLKFHSVIFHVNLCHGKWEKNLTKWILPSADQFWATTQHTHETLFKNKYSRFKNKYSQFKNKYSHHIDTATRTNMRWVSLSSLCCAEGICLSKNFPSRIHFTQEQREKIKGVGWMQMVQLGWVSSVKRLM